MRVEVEDDVLALVEQLRRERHGGSVTWLRPSPSSWRRVVVDAEVVGHLVDHRDPHLLHHLGLVGAHREDRPAEDLMRSGITMPS